jgi:hypothetical protein
MNHLTIDGAKSYKKQALTIIASVLAAAAMVCVPACQTSSQQPGWAAVPKEHHSPAMARYYKQMEDRLGTIWYRLVEIHMRELDVGTVATTFEIPAAGGKVRNVKVTSNTAGQLAGSIAVQALTHLQAPPIPREVLAELDKDYLLAGEEFTTYERR